MFQEPIEKYMRGVCLHPKDTSEISLHVIQYMKLSIIYRKVAILIVHTVDSKQLQTVIKHGFLINQSVYRVLSIF